MVETDSVIIIYPEDTGAPLKDPVCNGSDTIRNDSVKCSVLLDSVSILSFKFNETLGISEVTPDSGLSVTFTVNPSRI